MRKYAVAFLVSLAGTTGAGPLWNEAQAAMPTPVNPQVTDVVKQDTVRVGSETPARLLPPVLEQTSDLPDDTAEDAPK
jgi:hypothetical protein